MAKSNKTEYAILGILCQEPMSGYAIRRYVQESIGFFWQESFGQIYPALARLTRRKLVTKRKAKTSRGPTGHVYTPTATGRQELARWLSEPPDPEPLRNELLLKLFFGAMARPADLTRHVEELLAVQKSRLAQFSQLEKHALPEHQDDANLPFWRATLRFGQQVTRARVRWCQETLKWLEDVE